MSPEVTSARWAEVIVALPQLTVRLPEPGVAKSAARFGLALLLAGTWGNANLVAAESHGIEFSRPGGLCDQAFELSLTTAAGRAEIFYTTNGAVPAPENGRRFQRPLRIATTTVLRAAVFVGSTNVGPVATRSFVFPHEVREQTGAAFPPTWGVREGQPVRAAYALSRGVLERPGARADVLTGLAALPSVCVTLPVDDLFGAEHGLYAHPLETGEAWERAASVEFFPADGGSGFQIDGGARIQGGWNRRPEESPKHAFRLAFRNKYGAAKLRYPLFPGGGPQEFKELILRAGSNNTWQHWSGEERHRGDYLRDEWLRDTHAALGHPAARGRFVHLYLNGLYWGIYNLTERPDEHFAVSHLGGAPKDFDARNADHVLSGDTNAWNQLLTLANAGLREDAAYQAVRPLLDVPAFIDYMLVNLYGSNADWDRASNWYAVRRRKPAGPFQFIVWDGERTLEDPRADILAADDDQSPLRLFQKLRENAAFRREFGARARALLTGDGVLSPASAAARFRRLAEAMDPAIVAESARWGGYRREQHSYKTGPYELYTREQHWRPEIQRLLTDYFPKRTELFIEQLRDVGLYPPAGAE